MKQEINNEIDLLLRRFGRRPSAGMDLQGEHLDADELSAYAENALPGAARATYTEHLAECSRCRELVVKLSSSAGIVVAAETARAPERFGLKGFLASLFSPLVLRYWIPALGLIVVAVIGIGLWRRDAPGDYVSQSAPPVNSRPVASASNEQPTPSEERFVFQTHENDPASPAATPAPGSKRGEEQADAPAPVAAAPPPASVTTDESRDAAEKKKEEQPAAKTVSELPAATPSAAVEQARRLEVEARKQQNAPAVPPNVGPQTVTTARARAPEPSSADSARADQEAAKKDGDKKNETANSKSRAAQGAGTGSVARLHKGGDNNFVIDGVDTRAVAGRRFRRSRGIWFDSAYDASAAMTRVSRGSEQFRALVADEPGIKTIAEQLDGEVIVVWKGRTYRIR